MAWLVLVRHGKSEYNVKGLWTGWADPGMTDEGFAEAHKAGDNLKDIHFDLGFTSDLKRAKQTLDEIKKVIGQEDLAIVIDKALRERNYGIYIGKNKWKVKSQVGEEDFKKIRRSWDYPIPKGESLKQVYERVIPFYEHQILPKLKKGGNILVSGSGNGHRALVKYLENIPDDAIANLEIATGEIYLYEIDQNGKVVSKQIRAAHPNAV